MDLGIAQRKALVFGGSRGMGRACARQLAMEGVQVTIAARTRATLQQTAAELLAETRVPVAWVVADITTAAGRDAALAACPSPDILVNNADGRPPGDFRDWSSADWHEALDAMMLGPIEMIRRTVDPMIERGFGRIVNIVSRSVKTPQAELGLSNGARSGLVGFVAGLARQTVRHGVTINNILPGVFATDAQRHHIEGLMKTEGKSFEQLWDERGRNNPAGRFGRAEEVGALCAYVCSAHAGYITGQSLLIDGGAYPGTF
ncbi:putative oxidoreductase, SDR family [Variovorax paradoxus B4]|uniref:Putative oxidoreductase, SDR family n=1 Tax=Variovorax paradoxus B4 TaxID=1246301 RepID=T1XKF4_VARPD|nr:SDR family oxidoreductase [Variovorax paradoxus]AGU53367.1 putative oxidoreductase, SDR family [Variovorax paradoxus B4]